jgi:hypothetical protein
MLAANVSETPRPRPPAKVRRSASKPTSTPPPSYASAFSYTPARKPPLDTILGSSLPVTLQRVRWDKDNLDGATTALSPAPEDDMEWMNEKSREELSELLVKADDLIKERENGMQPRNTSRWTQWLTVYSLELGHVSAVCKTLYDNNVAIKSKHQALLARLPSSPSRSPSPEPLSSRYSISLSRPVSEYNSSPGPLLPNFKGHARKISVSTSEISHLADQNAELLEKLEKLESDSFSADQSGRRELKRLEKDIAALRDELEKTQARSEELEEKAKAGFAWDSEKVVQEVLRKKIEREERFRAMRNLGQGLPSESEGDSEIRDFAPESSFYPPGDTPRRASGTPFRRPPLQNPEPAQYTQPGSSLISQLLQKIQELENTNARIIEQQTETANQLISMQRETEHMTRVYECFADENLIELADDLEPAFEGAERPSHEDTIRFTSLKRNLGAESVDVLPDDLGSSLNHPRNVSRTRKSVMGLFDSSFEEKSEAEFKADQRAFSLPVPFASSPCSDGLGTMRSISTGLLSPALSNISLSSRSQGPDPLDNKRPTLQAELQNEFGDSWGLNAGHHLRQSSSLYDFSQVSMPPSPSPSPSRLPQSRCPSEEQQTPLPTSMSAGNPIMRLSVEPPTPEDHKRSDNKQTKRYHAMSETIRSRTNRWVDGRFKEPDNANTNVHANEDKTPSASVPHRLADAFDAAVENVTRPTKEWDDSSPSNEETGVLPLEKKPRGLTAVMLEIWLWLQFAIIILVFLWAMAKRGPKSFLGHTGHDRRVSSST